MQLQGSSWPRQLASGLPTELGFHDYDSSVAFNPQAQREQCLHVLIEANANLEAADEDGTTGLIWAVRKRNESCLRALIEANANLEATEKDGSTALMIAARDARLRSKGPSTTPVGPLPPWTTLAARAALTDP